jgi:hypothetical protein
MKLQMGVEDHAYSARYSSSSPLPASVKKRVAKRPSPAQLAYGATKTTEQVAADLEKKYGLIETFYGLEEDSLIIPLLEDAFGDALASEMSGKPVVDIITSKETDKIENRFRRNLSTRRYDGVIRGVPTLSAQRGVSHLRQKPSASRGPRPSFVDTGLYMRSFKTWVE